MAAMPRLRVVTPKGVYVNGRQHELGAEFDVPDDRQARTWVAIKKAVLVPDEPRPETAGPFATELVETAEPEPAPTHYRGRGRPRHTDVMPEPPTYPPEPSEPELDDAPSRYERRDLRAED